jgi:hypothetical protein
MEEIEYLPYIILPNLDYESQLESIKSLLNSHKKADEVVSKDIGGLTELIKNYIQQHDGLYLQYLHEERSGKIHLSIYQSAAHCLASVGMLAPFVESLFFQGFNGIRKIFFNMNKPINSNARWAFSEKKTWDCHYVWSNSKRRKDLVKGIMQLAEAIELDQYLPENLELMLTVLFSYRNKILHHGFEWPLEERQKYSKRIEDEKWPTNWFNFATSGDEPWIIYLSDEFVEHCLEIIDSTINGFSLFLMKQIENLEKTK